VLHLDIRSKLERVLPFGWMIVGMAILYLFWIFVTRDLAWGPVGQKSEQLLPWLSGSEPKILAFYSSPTIVRGEPGTICYGVLNVKSVRLDPPVDQITPSLNRCIAISPRQATTYTLYAEGNDGRQLTASFSVAVVPPAPSIEFISVSTKTLERGDRYAICYGVKHATSVKLEPSVGMPTPVARKHCIMFYPQVSMEYKLTATGEDGRTEAMKIPLKVIDRKKKT
jgi:hypothetical protein